VAGRFEISTPLPDYQAPLGALPHRRVNPEIERELLADSAIGFAEFRHGGRGCRKEIVRNVPGVRANDPAGSGA